MKKTKSKISIEKKNLLIDLIYRNCYIQYEDLIEANKSDNPQSIILAKLNKDTIVEVPEPMYVSRYIFLFSI